MDVYTLPLLAAMFDGVMMNGVSHYVTNHTSTSTTPSFLSFPTNRIEKGNTAVIRT